MYMYTSIRVHTVLLHACVCVPYVISVITQDGESALIKAAYWGKTEVVVELVKAGALLNLQNTVCPHPIIHDVHILLY